MVTIPAGTFTMGCDVGNDSRCGQIEGDSPSHEVKLPAFRIARFEVSQESYLACVEARACSRPSCAWDPVANPRMPVVCVTWEQAQAYCRFRGARLPTEAEWEKAARGTDGRAYPWGNEPATCGRANAHDCVDRARAVDAYPEGASVYGVLNLAGNVSEWVADWYDAGYYRSEDAASAPKGPPLGTVRVQRGGSYLSLYTEIDDAHVATRNYAEPGAAMPTLGFRCASD